MKEIITEISNSFLIEALSSPRMLEDLASMEKYMAESYDGRTFIELLQNADDAKSNRVKVFLVNDTLVVANDGRPFNEKDIIAICRSGASSKKRGSNIGYRGVGFKSATSISTEIVIYSAETYFTFSKSICARNLGKNKDEVPTVRIPFIYDSNQLSADVNKAIECCKNDGFNTFFIFLNSNRQKFLNELDGFDIGWLLFLRHVSEVCIECDSFKKKSSLERKKISDSDYILNVNESNNQWYVVSRDNVSIAFKYDNINGIVPCDIDEAVFHCFLPTLEKTGFPFKVNADFSTDPSRKHIILDESSKKAMYCIQRLFVDIVNRTIRNEDESLYPIISLLNNHTTLNSLVAQFENGLLEKLRMSEWVLLDNGQYVKPENAKIFSKWLSISDKNLIYAKLPWFTQYMVDLNLIVKVEKIENLFSKLGVREITGIELSDILLCIDYIKLLPINLLAKIFVYCYRSGFFEKNIFEKQYLPLDKGYLQLSDTSGNTILSNEFIESISYLLNEREKESLAINYEVFSVLKKKNNKAISLKKQNDFEMNNVIMKANLAVNKWKTPNQNCVVVETLKGNIAKDVGKKSDEYGVISTDSVGNVSYIAVKTVSVLGDSFKLSEKEYYAAQKFKENYKIYIFTTNTSNLEYSIIINPIDSMHLKKVVKEWEWICTSREFDDDEIKKNKDEIGFEHTNKSTDRVDFDNMNGQDFERFCAYILTKNGYEDVSLTKTSGDQGIDIVAYKDSIKYGIQCKCYSTDIGNNAVQEVFAGKSFYKCNIGIVLTNQHFTSSAKQLAENSGIVLWEREMLLKLLKNSQLYNKKS